MFEDCYDSTRGPLNWVGMKWPVRIVASDWFHYEQLSQVPSFRTNPFDAAASRQAAGPRLDLPSLLEVARDSLSPCGKLTHTPFLLVMEICHPTYRFA